MFHSSPKLTVNGSEIDKAFGSIHQSFMMKTKKFASEDWIVKTILEHGIKIFYTQQ